MISSDYERGNDCNKNTPESSSLDPDGKVDSPDVQSSPLKMDEESTPPTSALRRSESTDRPPSQARLSKAALRRHRLRSSAEGSSKLITSNKDSSGANSTNSIDNTTKTPNDNPAFSSRSARAAAGKRERKGKCVLCVEDNIINLKVWTRTLFSTRIDGMKLSGLFLTKTWNRYVCFFFFFYDE
jgi:hypothetical protein